MNTEAGIILYADDDEDDRQLLQEAVSLLPGQYEVISAVNGVDALDKLRALHASRRLPCVIVLDGNMPFMNGAETAEEICNHADWKSIPVCIFTTSPTERFAELAQRLPVGVYTKPTSIKVFLEIIEHFLDHCKRS